MSFLSPGFEVCLHHVVAYVHSVCLTLHTPVQINDVMLHHVTSMIRCTTKQCVLQLAWSSGACSHHMSAYLLMHKLLKVCSVNEISWE